MAAAHAPPVIAEPGVETELNHDGQPEATEAVGEKPILNILPPVLSCEQKIDISETANQMDTEVSAKTLVSVAGTGPVSPGTSNSAGTVATGISASSGIATAVAVTAVADAVADPGIVTDRIAADGNEAIDKVQDPENNGQHGTLLNGVDGAVAIGEMDTGVMKEGLDEEALPPEVDGVQVPSHWHPKPCMHITSIGGQMGEEELLSLFTAYGQVSSISFENERRDSAIIRYEHSSGDADVLVVQVREALNNTKLGDRTLIVEPYRPDSLLFIGNLTPDIDDTLLRKMFEPHGRIERAFVLRNAEGWSKGYGFVEYSVKVQASSAKLAMGNINMDGRVLRVEWSDCRRVIDMFSAVLFVDRILRDDPNVELSLRNIFGLYGKVRDCYVAIGIHQHFRGFAFIGFYHSIYADKAHRGLDGHELEGSNIRVSFANPSKSAQSYKLRFGSSPSQAALGFFGRRALDHTLQSLVPGMLMGTSLRGSMAMPLLASRLMGSGRPGMLGMGIGMQFGRGTLDRRIVSPILGGGAGMLASGSVATGMIGGRPPIMIGNAASRSRMAAGGNLLQVGRSGFSAGRGAIPITSTAIVQVATAQAKAREEEAKARAEALKQTLMKPVTSDQQSTDQYRLNPTQQNYYQEQTYANTDQQYKQADPLYSYQQPTKQNTYHAWMQQHQYGQQTRKTYTSQHDSQPSQNYMQQQQTAQATDTQQEYGYAQQYSQQYGQQYSQQSSQSYGQMYRQDSQTNGQQYQATQQQSQTSYTQQNYTEQYFQQQPTQELGHAAITSVSTAGSVVLDPSQQQAYTAYYQQQAQAQSGTTTLAASATANTQQSYEAEWAAYYASQAAYQQQQASTTDVGQKRTADQMESPSQNQAAYDYAQAVPTTSGYTQQAATGASPYQQESATISTYQQVAPTMAGYQQPGTYQ